MGNICCEGPTQSGNLDIHLNDPSGFHFEQVSPFTITNTNVQERYNQFLNRPLEFDSSKYPGTKLRQSQRQVNRNFIYQGTWRDNVPEGQGRILFENQQYFEGEFKDGMAQGKGRYIFSDGDYYEGQIDSNKAEGQGKYIGMFIEYKGEWKDSKPTVGTYLLRKSSTVVMMSNEREGDIEWVNGNRYKGEIENQAPHGYGKMYFNNGSVYEGDWIKGVFDGYGTFTWANGKIYKGQYSKGLKHGMGQFIYSDSKRYEGEWRDGKQHGRGKLFQNDILTFDGVFENGVPTTSSSKVLLEKTQDLSIPKAPQLFPAPIVKNPVLEQPKRMNHHNDEYYNTYEVR